MIFFQFLKEMYGVLVGPQVTHCTVAYVVKCIEIRRSVLIPYEFLILCNDLSVYCVFFFKLPLVYGNS